MDGPVGGRGRSVVGAGLASRGVRSPPPSGCPHGARRGQGRIRRDLTQAARRNGFAGYPGDGTQRWPAVHALDAAVLFRLVLETAPAGTAWHAVADEGDAVRDIAAVIGRRLGLAVRAVPEELFGPLGPIFAADQPSSSAHTQEALGWQPRTRACGGPGEYPALILLGFGHSNMYSIY